MLARRQLRAIGIDHNRVRNQIAAGRWVQRTPTVVSTTTGPLSREQMRWLAVLHAGPDAMLGGLSAAEVHGLRNWHRDDITVLVDDQLSLEDVPGVTFFRTRRDLAALRDPASRLPVALLEPAVLLFAAYDRSLRTGLGALAAVVQQRHTTPELLRGSMTTLRPLRRARHFRAALADMEGGSQSVAELDVLRMCRRTGLPEPSRQQRRRDSSGRVRFTDAEWRLPSGTVLVLEVDGAFHMGAETWEDDLRRHRGLSGGDRIVVRCTARELRDEPAVVARDLRALGLRSCA